MKFYRLDGEMIKEIKQMPENKWYGSKPDKCQICKRSIYFAFVDGRTVEGPWAMMCAGCHSEFGVGLGLGKGQRYVKDGKVWIKEEG